MNYFIITAAKNEEKDLPNTIHSIEKQTIKPILWVIIDDGSTDKTPQIIENVKKKNKWIRSIQLKESKRDLSIRYATICNIGFDYGIKYCNKNKLTYEYIGIVDADMSLESTYFENLIKEFENDSKLGIASGGTWVSENERLCLREDIPSGGHRLWRKKCFEDTKGYSLTYAPDSVSNVKAKIRGWNVKRFEEYKATQARMTCSAEGLWKGWKKNGESAYYLNAHPLYVVARAIRYLFKSPNYIGIAYFIGYINSYVNQIEKSDDEEIKYYYRYIRPKEIKKIYWDKIKKIFE